MPSTKPMSRKKDAFISEKQLGSLIDGGMVEARYGKRGKMRLYNVNDKTKVWSKIASDEDGNELSVLMFPPDNWEEVLDVVGIGDTDKDMVRMGDMIWTKQKSTKRWVDKEEFMKQLDLAGIDLDGYLPWENIDE